MDQRQRRAITLSFCNWISWSMHHIIKELKLETNTPSSFSGIRWSLIQRLQIHIGVTQQKRAKSGFLFLFFWIKHFVTVFQKPLSLLIYCIWAISSHTNTCTHTNTHTNAHLRMTTITILCLETQSGVDTDSLPRMRSNKRLNNFELFFTWKILWKDPLEFLPKTSFLDFHRLKSILEKHLETFISTSLSNAALVDTNQVK